jgi:parallel beta-helix repeat protein
VYKAYPGEEPILTTDYFYSRTVHIKNTSFIEINGLTVTSTGQNGPGIGLEEAHHVRVLNCVLRDNSGPGINTNYGIDYITIEGNRIYGNAQSNQHNASAISVWNASGPIYDNAPGYHNIIRNNIIYDNRNLSTTPTDGNGIIMDNNDRGGTDSLRLGKTLIANNVIFHNGGRCIHVLNSSNVDVVHNTCWHNLETERLAEGCNGEITLQKTYSYASSVNIKVYNNIAYGRGGTCWSGSKERPVFQVFDAVQYEADYNLWYNGSLGWASPGPNDVFADPMFRNPSLDPAVADFLLMGTSLAIDSGTDQFARAVPKDYLGVSRPQGEGFNMGAYE